MKQMTSGDNKTLNATYNSRMLGATFSVSGSISKSYDYFADGKLRFSSDLLDHRFDRSYAFDHVARLKSAFSGAEARGEPATTNRPYHQTNGYDAFNHLTQRTVKIWWTSDSTVTHSYTNNRHAPQGSAWQYDADGRLLSSFNDFYTYDAAGLTTHIEVPATSSIHTSVGYDGDGRQVRTDETTWDEATQTEVTETKYYLRSSVLEGQVLTEILDTNAGRTFVYAGQAIIAWQWLSYGWEVVDWEHKDPSGASVRRGGGSQELDPLGGDAGVSAQTQIPDEGLLLSQGSSYSPANPNVTYSRDGIRVPADDFMAFAGSDLQDPLRLLEFLAKAPWETISQAAYDELRLIRGREASVIGGDLPDLTLLPQKPSSPVPLQTTGELRDEFKKLLRQDKCKTFVGKLIVEAESHVDPSLRLGLGFEDLFENMNGGYVLVDGLNLDGYAVNGLVDRNTSSIQQGNAQVMIRTRSYFTGDSPREQARSYASQRRSYVASAFHETFHHLGKVRAAYGDESLGRAAFALTGDNQLLPTDNDPLKWSTYWDNQLMKHCMPDLIRAGNVPQ